MTKNLTKTVYKQNLINEDLHRLLLRVTDQDDFEPIFEKVFEEDGEVKVLRSFKLQGDVLRALMLNSVDITVIGSEDESIEVKKEVFLVEKGVIMVFHHIVRCFKDSNTQTWITISERVLSEDQTITERERGYLEDEIINKLKEFL